MRVSSLLKRLRREESQKLKKANKKQKVNEASVSSAPSTACENSCAALHANSNLSVASTSASSTSNSAPPLAAEQAIWRVAILCGISGSGKSKTDAHC